MKKRFLCFCAALLLMLSACASSPAPVESAPAAEPTAAVETVEPEAVESVPAQPVRLGAMTGPTGIGMVKLFADAEETQYTRTIVGSADELTPKILQGELDIVSVPANLASVLYQKTGGGVQALAVNVLGVLYIGELGGETVQSFADLKGQTIYATGKGSTPEYFLRYVLRENGVDPDTDVDIQWKSEPNEVLALLNAQGSGIAMLPQPSISAASAKLGENFRIALSLSDAWEAIGNGSLCTTAVILARTEFAKENPQAVESFLADYAASAAWVNENPGEAAQLCNDLEVLTLAVPVLTQAIPKCNVVCITGQEMKTALSGCLEVLMGENPKAVGGELPGGDFYYGA